jgi:hypothetical protein
MFPTIPSFIILGIITGVFAILTLREDLLKKSGK